MPKGVYERKDKTIADRIMRLSIPEPNSGCWIWLGRLDRYGYGRIAWALNKPRSAHRVSYEEFVGPIPANLNILHSCDTRCCVNPAHLRPGTTVENVDDMIKRRRAFVAHGMMTKTAKLTDQDVIAIRASTLKQVELARMYGVTDPTILKIKKRITWKHI